MNIQRILGILLIAGGGFFLVGGTFPMRREVLDVGGLSVTTDEQRSVRPWIAGAVLLAGLTILLVDVRRAS